jgi:hypothetical protein
MLCIFREVNILTNNKNKQLEDMIQSVRKLFEDKGYKTIRFSETKEKYLTTNYDVLIIRGEDGIEYDISFDKSIQYDENWCGQKPTNIIKEITGE